MNLAPSASNNEVTPLSSQDETSPAAISVIPFMPSLATLKRNSATLTALQELMQANLAANAHRRLTHEAEVEQLRVYEDYAQATSKNPELDVLRSIERALDHETRNVLRNLAEACVQLGYMPPYPSGQSIGEDGVAVEVGRRVISVTAETFELQNQLRELDGLGRSFEREAQRTREIVEKLSDELESEAALADLDMVRGQTTRFARETKQIVLKLKEYGERTRALERHVEDLAAEDNIESISEKEKTVEKRREEVKRLEMRLKAYHGLPPDVEASRAEVRRVRDDLERWKRRREEVFEGISR